MDYGAISLDTSIFDSQGLRLESGMLKTLEQFNGKPSYLILSEIVVREVQAHLAKRTKDVRASVVKAIRDSKECLFVSGDEAAIATGALIPEFDDNEAARRRLETFILNTDAAIISATKNVNLEEIIKMYFQNDPPFEVSGKKKNEFPDAIALVSLEYWAKEHKTKILAVAKDEDWKKFAEQSEYIDVIEDLAEAIFKFQPHSSATEYSTYIAKKLAVGQPAEIYELIEDYLADEVSNLYLNAEASSPFFYEPDYVEATLDGFKFVCNEDGHALLQPVQGQDSTLIVEAKILVDVTATAEFSMSVRDSVDKDYVPLGTATANTKFEFETEVLFTFEGDFDKEKGDIQLVRFELLSHPDIVDFGEIEPDGWHED